MRRLIWVIFYSLFVLKVVASTQADDNVVIDNRVVSYVLKPKNGKLNEVKVSETTYYVANRADERMYAVTFYGDGITIDKAQAPDSKPVYRAWEDDDLFYTGSRVCALPINLKKGKPAKVVFERTYKEPEQFCQIMLISPYYTRHVEYRISVPAVLADKIVLTPKNFYDGMELSRRDEPNGDVTYSVTLDNEEPFRSEPLSGSADMTAPQILVKGYFDGVSDLYSFLRAKVNDNETSDSVDELTSRLCAGLSSDQQKIDAIADWVRNNIRYVGIEHGEYGLKPDDAESVLSKRFGDCKGSANLIRTMLRSAGIDGRLVWIGTRGDVPGDWTEVESLAAGNHQIAAAVVGDSIIFIDGTTQFAPRGFIPSSIAGQQCMVLDGDNPLITTVPQATASILDLAGDVSLTDDENLAGHYTMNYGGGRRVALLASLSAISAPKRTSALQVLLAFDRQGVRAENIVVNEGASDDMVATVTFNEVDKAAVRQLSSGKTYVQLRPLRAALYPTIDANNRRHDILFRYPYDVTARLVFDIPEGYALETVPEKISIVSPWFVGYVDYQLDEAAKKVVCTAEVRCVKTEGSATDAESWNNAVKEIRKASNAPLVLIKK